MGSRVHPQYGASVPVQRSELLDCNVGRCATLFGSRYNALQSLLVMPGYRWHGEAMAKQPTNKRRLTFLVKAAELTQRVATGPILDKYRLSYAQLAMLLSIASSPGRSGAQLARMHGITAQSAGELTAAMVRRGLVERRLDPRNARILLLHLTADGEQLCADAQGQLDSIDARLTKGLAEADLAVARRVLAAIIANGDNIDLARIDSWQN